MPIQINGSGTITGITAGGLPDGSIATDDIANNAVTAGKLATTLDLSGKTVTLPSGAGGQVLQYQYVRHTSSTQLTSSGAFHELTSSLRIAFTPVSDDSTLILHATGTFCSPNSGNISHAAFYDVTNSAYVDVPTQTDSRRPCHWAQRTTPHDGNDHDYMTITHAVANTNTTARTYTLYHSTEGKIDQFLASTLSGVGGFNSPLFFSITEVAN